MDMYKKENMYVGLGVVFHKKKLNNSHFNSKNILSVKKRLGL